MKKNDPQLCICPFDPSYILTPVQLDINNRCVGRAEKERTQERRNNNAPVPLRAQMFNYSRKQQMALSSFNVCACDRDEIVPQTKRNVGSNVSFRFVCFFRVVERSRPIIQHLNGGVSGALSWSPRCSREFSLSLRWTSEWRLWKETFPSVVVWRCPRCWNHTEQPERAARSPIKTKWMRFFHMWRIR